MQRKHSDDEDVDRGRKLSDPESWDSMQYVGSKSENFSSRQPKSFFDVDASSLVTLSLCLLCVLASLDLWRQYALHDDMFWHTAYTGAAKSSENFWKLGFHIEDLELKVQFQTEKFESIRHAIGVLNPPLRHSTDTFTKRRNMQSAVHKLVGNDTSIVQIRCENLQSASYGDILRVGFSDFRADPMDKCQIFTSTSETALGPHMMFEIVPLDEKAFALKNIGNDLFIQVILLIFSPCKRTLLLFTISCVHIRWSHLQQTMSMLPGN